MSTKEPSNLPEKTPENQASERGGNGGIIPPPAHRWKPGQSGNPAGRTSFGASVVEHMNTMADLTEEDLRRIGRNRKETSARRSAAERVLRLMEAPDLADFAGLLRGENNLEDLRAMGVNTEAVKKFKQKTRRVPIGEGETEEVIEREIELYDRAGSDFDRVLDRTAGKPAQAIQITGENGGPVQIAYDLSKLSKEELLTLRQISAKAMPEPA